MLNFSPKKLINKIVWKLKMLKLPYNFWKLLNMVETVINLTFKTHIINGTKLYNYETLFHKIEKGYCYIKITRTVPATQHCFKCVLEKVFLGAFLHWYAAVLLAFIVILWVLKSEAKHCSRILFLTIQKPLLCPLELELRFA